MRIVDRKTFLTLPAGTVYVKYPAQSADKHVLNLGHSESLTIKGDTIGNDWVAQGLFPAFQGAYDTDAWVNVMVDMLACRESPPVDYDYAGRDGLFDEGQLFAVWSKADLTALIARLQLALEDGYSA